MKDYNLVRHVAKLLGAKPKRDKSALLCYFLFGDDIINVLVTFKNKTSNFVLFNLTEVYETHGKKYGTYEEFAAAFTEKYKFFGSTVMDGVVYIGRDLSVNKIEHVASPALTCVSAVMECLNDMFGTEYEIFTEDHWRGLHRDYLAKQSRKNLLLGWAGVGLWILCIVMFFVAGSADKLLLALLCFPAGSACFIAFIVFFVKRRYYKSELIKSLRAW
ncbi:MAG: hypothetical protein K2N22_05635 [Clostridia bacterium]|nr:hypothetical protein [Clostridia bacterium]